MIKVARPTRAIIAPVSAGFDSDGRAWDVVVARTVLRVAGVVVVSVGVIGLDLEVMVLLE